MYRYATSRSGIRSKLDVNHVPTAETAGSGMIIEREIASELRERDAERQSSLLLMVVGASALFWGIVYILLA